jgi:hypothetical protein
MKSAVVAAIVIAAAGVTLPAPQTLASVYADLPASACTVSSELVLTVEGAPVAIVGATAGPHPVSAVVLADTSPSMPQVPLETIAKRVAQMAQPVDRFRVATFGPKFLISTTTLVNQNAASRAVREVAQAKDGQRGPSPLWDAIHESVAVRPPGSVHVEIVFTDARSTGNDLSFVEVHDEVTRTGTVLVAVGATDDALPRVGTMLANGRNDPLRTLARDSAGDYMEYTRPKEAPPLRFLVDSIQNVRQRCRLDFVPPIAGGARQRLTVTVAGRTVRAPIRVPDLSVRKPSPAATPDRARLSPPR